VNPGDRVIVCCRCLKPFPFTERERDRMDALGFPAPRRCANCRRLRRERIAAREAVEAGVRS